MVRTGPSCSKRYPWWSSFVARKTPRVDLFELHIAQCAEWSNGLDAAVRTGKSQLEPPSAAQWQLGESTGPGSPADHWTW